MQSRSRIKDAEVLNETTKFTRQMHVSIISEFTKNQINNLVMSHSAERNMKEIMNDVCKTILKKPAIVCSQTLVGIRLI